MTDNRTRLLAAFTRHFGVIETTAADPLDAVIKRDLHPDSLDLVEVSVEVEDEFQIELTDEELMNLPETATLRDVLALVEGKLAPKAAA